jgi:hypothetical protein
MGNPDVVANSPQLQDPSTVNRLYQAGMGGTTGINALQNIPGFQNLGQSNNSFLDFLKNKLHGIFNGGQQDQGNNSSNSLLNNQPNLSSQDRQNINGMQPGQAYVVQGNQGQGVNSGYSYDNKGSNVVATPGEVNAVANGAQPTGTYAEKAGQYAGTKEELKEAGKIRANDIKDLADTVFNAQTKQTTLDNIAKIVSSPEFEQIRRTPILGHHELSYYEKFGSPEQQNTVGQLMTLSGNVIKDSARDFAGQFRKGEQQLLENMKINPGDTVDAARGKMEQLSYLNRVIGQRAKLTADIMQQNHMSKLKAEEIADKQINGDAIRSQIHNQLNPKPTDADIKYMADKYKTTPEDIKKRLKSKGIL